LYRYVKGFAFEPKPFKLGDFIFTDTFKLEMKDFARIPLDISTGATDDPPTRTLDEDSITYRLRCCKRRPVSPSSDEHDWVVAENVLPPHLYFEINGKMLDCRRKLHFKRDLPMDLTPYLQVGENTICVRANILAHDPAQSREVMIAVEKVGVTSYESVMDPNSGLIAQIPTSQTLDSIKSQLAPIDEDDDDEIAIVGSNITIGLMDPFYGCKIFDIPVRGAYCLHRECFDLDTFLKTRTNSTSPNASSPTAPDEWTCPICKADARPKSLVVDSFLVGVRMELAERGLLDTRAIIVEADGSWKPRPEKDDRRTPDEDADESASTLPLKATSATKSASVAVIVELSSDED